MSEQYNVAKISREMKVRYLNWTRLPDGRSRTWYKLATPERMRSLIDALQRFTDRLDTRIEDVRRKDPATWWNIVKGPSIVFWIFGSIYEPEQLTPEQFLADWEAWKERLGQYKASVRAAPPKDYRVIFWGVTAPLLYGWYGGEQSKGQRPSDVVTPFALSNQIEIVDEFRKELIDQFLADANPLNPANWPWWLTAGALLGAAALVLQLIGGLRPPPPPPRALEGGSGGYD